MNDDEIIRVAHLMRAVDQDASPEELERALAAMERSDITALWLAAKLLDGLPYSIVTNNPGSVRRALAVARRLGAVAAEVETDGRITRLRFDLPVRH